MKFLHAKLISSLAAWLLILLILIQLSMMMMQMRQFLMMMMMIIITPILIIRRNSQIKQATKISCGVRVRFLCRWSFVVQRLFDIMNFLRLLDIFFCGEEGVECRFDLEDEVSIFYSRN